MSYTTARQCASRGSHVQENSDVYRAMIVLVITIIAALAAWPYGTLRPTDLPRLEVLDGDTKRDVFVFDPLSFHLTRDQMLT
jgi:hypothetical protein